MWDGKRMHGWIRQGVRHGVCWNTLEYIHVPSPTNLCIPGQSSQHVQGYALQLHEPLPTPGSTKMDVGTSPHAECRVVHLSCDFRSAMYP